MLSGEGCGGNACGAWEGSFGSAGDAGMLQKRGGPGEGLRGCAAPGPRKRERNPIPEHCGGERG